MFYKFEAVYEVLQFINQWSIFANDLNHVLVVNINFGLEQFNPCSNQMLQLLYQLVFW